eukprot:434305_1
MPNYAPFVIISIDLILLSSLTQQLWSRYVVREQIVHKRKDIYRIVIVCLLAIKICYSVCWLLYQYIKPWVFWVLFGTVLSICVLLQGDFASFTITHERNISENVKKKRMLRGLLIGSAVLSSTICLFGIVLSINIQTVPMWQSFGFATSLLNGFITYKMVTSVMSITREKEEYIYYAIPSITAKELEKQLLTLFRMKQMVVPLVFIGLHAIYTFTINLYYIFTKKK